MHEELSRPPSGGPSHAAPDPETDARARALLARDDVARTVARLRDDDARTLNEQCELTAIAAPPFGEGPRAARMAELMTAAGLDDVTTDAEGNVVARLGPGAGPPLVVAAHLDTVFPAGTDVTVRRQGDRLLGPGISDDGRGLAALLALSRALTDEKVALAGRLLVVATVGEEGVGDLRGVRHLFSPEGAVGAGCRGFVSLDGAGNRRIVNVGLGSKRHRARVTGPGGHSWVDWRFVANPIHALGRAVAALADLPLPEHPATTLTVGRWSGGTSVNAIPREAWLEVEIRSEHASTLADMEASALDILRAAVDAEDPRRQGGLKLGLEALGDRPAGSTAADTLLVRSAAAATRALGYAPELAVSSTDANLPMSLGIPAITLGAGGEAGAAHTPDEWYRNRGGPEGLVRALLTLLLADLLLAGPNAGE